MAGRKQLSARERKKQLSDELAIARETIGYSRELLKESANVKKKLVRKVQENKGKIAFGSALATLAVATVFKRKKNLPIDVSSTSKGAGSWIKKAIIGFAIRKAKGVVLQKAVGAIAQRASQNDSPDYYQ